MKFKYAFKTIGAFIFVVPVLPLFTGSHKTSISFSSFMMTGIVNMQQLHKRILLYCARFEVALIAEFRDKNLVLPGFFDELNITLTDKPIPIEFMANNSSISSGLARSNKTVLRFADSHESKLWNDFRNGDKSAFAVIYTKFFPVLYRYGLRVCKDNGLVQDCIQDLFIDLSRLHHSLSGTTSVRYYLYRCMRRKIAVKLSRLKRYDLEPFEDHEQAEFTSAVILPIEFQQIEFEHAEEKKHEILKALQLLTKKQRKVIQLRFYEDMSYKEIASIMSVHIDTVYNLVSQATCSLRNTIKRSLLLMLILMGLDTLHRSAPFIS
jgi:RNA polymerase sigma factor (sigma-70 family)